MKMANRAMRRSVLEPKLDAKIREQAAKVYKAIGLPMPPERKEEHKFKPRMYGGSEVVSTFTPTPELPVLNTVHGPLANKKGLTLEGEVVSFPYVGAGERARTLSAASARRGQKMEVDDDEYEQANTPYFYPRRDRKKSGIRKKRHGPLNKKRPAKNVAGRKIKTSA